MKVGTLLGYTTVVIVLIVFYKVLNLTFLDLRLFELVIVGALFMVMMSFGEYLQTKFEVLNKRLDKTLSAWIVISLIFLVLVRPFN